MVIYLKHPIHGAKVATMEAEAEQDEQNGWLRFDPASPAPVLENALQPTRRGRPRKVVEES